MPIFVDNLPICCNLQNGRRPLSVATFFKRIDCIQLLIEHKADVNFVDSVCTISQMKWCCRFSLLQSGWTLLHLAAQEGHAEVTELLAKCGTPINLNNKVCNEVL